jgi:SAM-dependent methyltransferase
MSNTPRIFGICPLDAFKGVLTHQREPFFEFALRFIKPTDRVLDIGSGDGAFARMRSQGETILFDGNPETIRNLRNEFEQVVEGVLPDLPFKENEFDVIHCSHVIEHLNPDELYKLLTNIDRCLRCSGKLILSFPVMWNGFYDDLSHIRPYDENVIYRYLSSPHSACYTRPAISSAYKVVDRLVRYNRCSTRIFIQERTGLFSFLARKLISMISIFMQRIGVCEVSVTGKTIVLQKQISN